jgi:argininosuccinate lyase
MPQKKNPDVAELARGKVGRVYGKLIAMLTVMKGLPLSYNRDLQEDKEGLFDVVDTLLASLEVMTGMLETLKVNSSRMAQALDKGYLLATDIADYLVTKGETFRGAHSVVGQLVHWAIENERTFDKIKLEEYKKFSKLFEKDIYKISSVVSVKARDNIGGTSPDKVREALAEAKQTLEESK